MKNGHYSNNLLENNMIMILNRNDIRRLVEKLDKYEVDNFTIIKHDESGIGYTIDIEFPYRIKDEIVTVTTNVVGTEDW